MKLNDIVPGNKLELELYNKDGELIKPVFVSEFEWLEDDGNAVIAAPIYEGIVYPVPVGAYMEVFFSYKHKESDRIEMYKFTDQVRGRRNTDNIALLDIEKKSVIEKIQRRQFFRFECSLPIKYRQVVSLNKEHNQKISFKKAKTRDISGGGICFINEDILEMDKMLEIEIALSEEDVRSFYETVIRVIRLENMLKPKYEIGILHKRIEDKDREAIIKYIFQEQRKLRKKGLI